MAKEVAGHAVLDQEVEESRQESERGRSPLASPRKLKREHTAGRSLQFTRKDTSRGGTSTVAETQAQTHAASVEKRKNYACMRRPLYTHMLKKSCMLVIRIATIDEV
jgi:hypothetical protein